ncbi:MAG: DMT family transporter [Bacteroidia bacterium]|nr:DMT family transporter [Bacteroidia bacterium]MDW8157285.1 DMT family transporter [Bacteroidia bacterium]
MDRIFESWILLALSSSLFESLKNLWSKKALEEGAPALMVAFATRFVSGLFFFPLVLPQLQSLEANNQWWKWLLIGAALNALNVFWFMRALAKGALSSTEPIMNFTPFFLLLTASFFLKEYPTLGGIVGMIFILLGAWLLNHKPGFRFWQPFMELLQAPGPRLMLGVAFVASLTTLFDKKGILLTSPLVWTCAVNFTISFFYLVVLVFQQKLQLLFQFHNNKWLLLAALANGLSSLCQMAALSLALTAYVISLKRTSAIFSLFWGYYFLKEFLTLNQLVGVLVMIAGVLIITFMQ